MNLQRSFLWISDFFFPNRCPFCDELIRWDELVCKECEPKLPFSDESICKVCGREPCTCGKEPLFYDGAESVYYYEGILPKGIYRLKEDKAKNLAAVSAEALAKKLQSFHADGIVPVPMDLYKKSVRGANQAEVLAKYLGRKLKLPVLSHALKKRRTRKVQHTLTAAERKENAKNVFSIGQADIKGKVLILCDDIMTTGSTVNICAELLKSMGAKEVYVAVIAVTRLRSDSCNQQENMIK